VASRAVVNRQFGVVVVGAVTLVLIGCSAASPTVSPGGSSAPSSSTVMPSGSAVATASVGPTGTPLDSASPSPATVTPTLPSSLASFKTVDVAGFPTTAVPSAPYSMSTGNGGVPVLYYDTGRAKGSAPIPVSEAELAYFSQSSSQIYPARNPYAVWDEAEVAVVVASQANESMPGICYGSGVPPVSWRILVAPLDKNGKPGSFSQYAVGRNALNLQTPNFEFGEGAGCEAVWPPSVALSSGLIAYNVERPTAGHPFGSEILVRSLADGSTIRDLSTPEYVYSLELSGTNLIWIEFPGVMTSVLPLRISTAAHPDAQDLLVYKTPGDSGDVEWNVPPYIVVGNVLAWQASSAGKVWERDLSTGKIHQISPNGLLCQLEDFDGTDMVMGCSSDPSLTAWDASFRPGWFVFWSPSGGYRVLTGTTSLDGWYSCQFSNGALWVDFADQSAPADTFWSIPMPALTGS
jgi:hypothetical protein